MTLKHIDNGSGSSLCGVAVVLSDLVTAALSSDCKACREIQMISPVNEKDCEMRPEPKWEQKPYPDLEAMVAELERRRDGR